MMQDQTFDIEKSSKVFEDEELLNQSFEQLIHDFKLEADESEQAERLLNLFLKKLGKEDQLKPIYDLTQVQDTLTAKILLKALRIEADQRFLERWH